GPSMARTWQWRTIAARGEQIWLAGSPGSVIVRSTDGGATWTATATGAPTPIESLTFVDAQRGWAVGALGTILVTRDGGRTWQAQRGGGRAAMLVATASPEHAPL